MSKCIVDLYNPTAIPIVHSPFNGTLFVVNQTDSLSIECATTGIPLPSLQWFKGGQGILEDLLGSPLVQYNYLTEEGVVARVQQNLTISPTHGSDTGDYTCVAVNTAGQDNVTFTIYVQGT